MSGEPKDDRFELLKSILFEEDREVQTNIKDDVVELRKELDDPEELRKKVEPFIDEKIEYIRVNFPELFGEVITKSIKRQIVESQDEVVDALYPIIGRLIRKFIVKEFEKVYESIDNKVGKTFSWSNWKSKLSGIFSGKKKRDLEMQKLSEPQVEEAFVIVAASGLLAGTYSRAGMLDRDMIAGMLTAIKSFVEDALNKERQQLEMIEYETYKLMIHNFRRVYIAVAVSGAISNSFRASLEEHLMNFSNNKALINLDDITEEKQIVISEAITKHINEYHYES